MYYMVQRGGARRGITYKLFIAYIFAFALWPTYAGIKIGSAPLINIQRIGALLLLALFLLQLGMSAFAARRAVSKILSCRSLSFFIFLYFGWRALSVMSSMDPIYSAFIVSVDLITQLLFFCLTLLLIKDFSDIKTCIKAILIGASVVILIGIIESVNEYNAFAEFAPKAALDRDYIASAISEKIRDTYRVQATFLHPLVLAEYLVLIIPLAVYVAMSKQFSSIFRVAALLIVVSGIYLLLRTGTRSGVLILGLEIAYALGITAIHDAKSLKTAKSFVRIVFFFCALIAGAMALYGEGIDLIKGRSESESMSSEARLDQLISGSRAVIENPMLGWGPGLAANYASTANVTTGQVSVDNYYLTIVVESGVPALFAFVGLLIMANIKARSGTVVGSNASRKLANYLSFSLFGFSIFCLILSIYEIFTIVFVMIAISALLSVHSSGDSQKVAIAS